MSRSRTTLLLSALAVAVVALPGCGGAESATGDGGTAVTGPGLAAAMPASSRMYGEVQLRPEGGLRSRTLALLGKVLAKPAADVPAEIARELDRDTDGGVRFADVEPLLGRRAAVAAWDFGQTDVDPSDDALDARVGAVVETPEPEKLFDLIRKEAGKVTERAYKGTRYIIMPAGGSGAAGIVDGRLVMASDERAIRTMIDVAGGKAALASAEGFKRGLEAIDGESLAHGWFDVRGIIADATATTKRETDREAAKIIGKLLGGGRIVATAALTVPSENGARVDVSVSGLPHGQGGSAEPIALASLPAGSWLALQLGDVGGQLRGLLDKLGELGRVAGQDPAQALAGLERQTGIDLRKDFADWMGAGALFVRGDSERTLDGALIIASKDGAKSRAALRKLVRAAGPGALRRLALGNADAYTADAAGPVRPVLAASGDRFVLAAGEQAARDAVDHKGGLGDDEPFKQAIAHLGGADPVLFAALPTVARLARPQAGDAESRRAAEVLGRLGALVAGTERKGDVLRARLVVTAR